VTVRWRDDGAGRHAYRETVRFVAMMVISGLFNELWCWEWMEFS
jgi:hypothetical protein